MDKLKKVVFVPADLVEKIQEIPGHQAWVERILRQAYEEKTVYLVRLRRHMGMNKRDFGGYFQISSPTLIRWERETEPSQVAYFAKRVLTARYEAGKKPGDLHLPRYYKGSDALSELTAKAGTEKMARDAGVSELTASRWIEGRSPNYLRRLAEELLNLQNPLL